MKFKKHLKPQGKKVLFNVSLTPFKQSSHPPLNLQRMSSFHCVHPYFDKDFTTLHRPNSKNFRFNGETSEWVNRSLINEKINSTCRH